MTVTTDDPGVNPGYRYYIADTLSDDLLLEVELTGVTFSSQIRRAGEFAGTLVFDSQEASASGFYDTMPGQRSLYVTRDSNPVWGGIISKRSYTVGDRKLALNAVSFEAAFYKRTIWHDLFFDNTVDQFDVVRAIIAQSQTDFAGLAVADDIATPYIDNASFGVQVESRLSGHAQDTQSFKGFELKSIGETLEAFSDNLNGFEYNIVVGWNTITNKFTKILRFRDAPPSQLPLGEEYTGERTGVDENFFEFPGNVINLLYEDTNEGSATRYFVVGAQPQPVETEYVAPPLTVDTDGDGVPDEPADGADVEEEPIELPTPRGVWENNAYLSSGWPIYEAVESSAHTGVSSQDTLNRYAESYGRRAAPPIPSWTVVVNGSMNPRVGDYRPGDWCRLVVTDPFVNATSAAVGGTNQYVKRIADISVSVPDTNQKPETVTLTLINEWDGGTT